MQGLESLNQFKKFVSSLGGLGRFEDTYMIHAAEGETVVPMEVLDRNPVLKKRLFKSMKALGIDPGRYIVGNDLNSLNPVTGQPEFFFKRLKKALGDVAGYAAPVIGAMYGPAAGALVGAGLGAFKRENPGDPSQWAQMGTLGGLGGIASNLAGGQNWLGGKGLSSTGMSFTDMLTSPFTKKGRGQLADYWNPKGFDMFNKTSGETGDAADFYNKIKDDPKWADFTSTELKKEASKMAGVANAVKGGMDVMEAMKLFGVTTIGGGILLDWLQGDQQDAGTRLPEYVKHGQDYGWGPATVDYGYPTALVAEGGIMDLQGGGHAQGPGTGTSDSIPAMLSDGEFVMTADAVRGAGGGDRREGARRMYEAMDRLEARA